MAFEVLKDTYPPVLTTDQVAEILSLNKRTVMAMATDGRLPASRLGRKYHFSRDDLIKRLNEGFGPE